MIVSIQNNGIQVSPPDSNYIGPASFELRAEDSDGLYDLKLVQFNFYDPGLQNTPPHLVNFPDTVDIAKDNSVTFNLVNFFIDSTHNISEVSWEFEPGANINYSFDSTTFRLSITPDTNWVGISTMRIKVSDPLGLSDEKNLIINVGGEIGPRSADEIIVYPNPCVYQNGQTEVVFDNLPEETQKVTLFNILGQKVFGRSFQELNNPYHLNVFDGQPLNLASGFYIYLFQGASNRKLQTGMFVIVR